jgi:hypothetical protein
VTWSLLAIGAALAAPLAGRRDSEDDAPASHNGRRREPVAVARSAP